MSNSINPISGIYKIENTINGKVYIGQSQDVARRLKDHKRKLVNHTHSNKHLQRSVDLYGIDNFSFEILEECDCEYLDDKEMQYIDIYNSFKAGYNDTLGGGGKRGYCISEETRQKLRENHSNMTGENNPMYGKRLVDVMGEEEYMAYINRAHGARVLAGHRKNGMTLSDEAKRKISEGRKRYLSMNPQRKIHTVSDETKVRISESNKIRHKENPELYYTKHIVLVNTGERFSSIEEASRKYRVDASSISMCCSGKNLSAGQDRYGNKYVWLSELDYDHMSEEERNDKLERAKMANSGKYKPNARRVRCVNTGVIFDTVTEAGKEMNVDISSISKCCRGIMRFAGKDSVTGNPFMWEFVS